jgi:hypothetical protein
MPPAGIIRDRSITPKPARRKTASTELRLDSPTGTFLGASPFLAPSEQMGFAPSPLTIPVKLPDDHDGEPRDVYQATFRF